MYIIINKEVIWSNVSLFLILNLTDNVVGVINSILIILLQTSRRIFEQVLISKLVIKHILSFDQLV